MEGYGRDYRERLLGHWGIVDVNDCCSCAQYLVFAFVIHFFLYLLLMDLVDEWWYNLFFQVECGKVDGERLCITGGSAGGYTTLATLAFKDTFKAGASLFGVSVSDT